MLTWLIGDTHFMHKNIIAYCGRPSDYDVLVEEAWKNSVGPRDLIIHLGDVCIGKGSEIENWHNKVFRYLPGDKLLVKGNHDHRPDKYFRERGWNVVVKTFAMTLKGRRIIFSHAPLDMKDYHMYDLNVHAHVHNFRPRGVEISDKHRLYCIEYENYKPVELEVFIGRK